MDLVVIGGGIVGAHVAAELAGRGAAVTLVDRGEEGGSTSARSFAWINCSNPDVDYLELRVRAVDAWGRAAALLGHPRWLSLPGTLSWAHDERAQRAIESHASLLAALGRAVERMTVAEVHRREPDLALPAGVETVYRFAGEGWVLTDEAVRAALARGAAAGLRVRAGTEVLRLLVERGGGRVTGVELTGGEELRADVVVSCAGRFTESLLRPAGVAVPMVAPTRGSAAVGLVVLTTPVHDRLRFVLHGDGLSVRPDRDGRLAVHDAAHDQRIAVGAPVPDELAGELVSLVHRRLRYAAGARVEHARVCVRALAADGLPVVGRARDGLYVIATHSGVTLAPALAQLAADELIDGGDSPLLAQFRPGRFSPRA